MADIDQEQLLNELLADVGSADRQMGAPNLEARVLAAWDAEVPVRSVTVRLKPDTTYRAYYKVICGMAAAALLALAWPASAPDGAPAGRPVEPVASAFAVSPLRRDKPVASTFAASPLRRDKPIARSPITPIAQSPLTPSPIEFIPLMPMTAQEMRAPFQIVRVQMPRASLGPLTPLQYPGELVEADVLLGEDGMARGIHISTNESTYPWRSR